MRNKQQHDDIDEKILKDGQKLVVPMYAMDSSRPGWRVSTNDAAKIARRDAYQSYENDLVNAWRGRDDTGAGTHNMRGEVGNSAPPGAYPYKPEAVGAACSIDGWEGRLVETNINGERWLVCRPISGDADFPRKKIKRNKFGGEEGEEEFERDKAMRDQARETAYRDYDLALSQQWRKG